MLATAYRIDPVAQKTQVDLEVLRTRIRERMEFLKVSGNSLSRRAGLGVSYVNDLLKGTSNRPSLENLGMIAEALKVDLAYILGTQDDLRLPTQSTTAKPDSVVALPTARRAGTDASRVPLFASPWPDAEGFFLMSSTPDESTPLAFEPVVGAYAVIVPDDTMAPRYFTGEKVFINPRRPISLGSFVVLKMNDGRSIIRKVIALDPARVVVTDLVTGSEKAVDRGEISTIHRITASCEA